MSTVLLQSLGWALVHLLWQGTLVAGVLALALLLVGRKAARARYGLACGALVLMLAIPVFTGWSHYAAARAAQVEASASSGVAPTVEPVRPGVHRTPRPAQAAVAGTDSTLEAALTFAGAHMPWLVLAWGLGVMACSLRLLGGWLKLRRLVRAALAAPAEWQQRMDALAARLGLPRAVRLLQSTELDVPAAMGWLKPVVLLPVTTLSGLSPKQLEMILAHELAHIRRHDFAINLLQTLLETLLFYHPAVWWVSHVIRVERENCCDDIAVGASSSPVAYARALTALETLRVTPMEVGPSAALAPSALGGSLPERVRRLVAAPGARCSSRWVAGASVLTLVSSVAVAAPLAVLALPAEPPAAVVERLTAPSVIAPVPGAPSAPPAPGAPPSLLPPAPPAPGGPRFAAGPAPHPAPLPGPRPHAPGEEDDDHDMDSDEDEALDARTRLGDNLTIDQLVALKVAGITPELAKSLAAVGMDTTVAALKELGHAGVTPEFVTQMNARFGRKLSAEELAQLKHLDVSADYLAAMKDAGFGDAPLDDLVGARAVGVTPEYLRKMKAAGFERVTLDELIGMRAVGVTPEYVAELGTLGYTKLSAEDVTQLRAVGVNPAYVAELGQLGYTKLAVEDVTQLRALGINAGFVRELGVEGLKNLSTETLTELRAVGVNGAFIRQMREAGLENLSVEELIRLRVSGVDADFIRRMKKGGP